MTENANPQINAADMPFFAHAAELRNRLLYCIIAIFIGAAISYTFATEIFAFLSAPYFAAFPGEVLIGTGPAEAFLLKLKMSIFAGAILMSPVLFYQVWIFISPGLHKHERKLVFPFLICTTALFVGGAAFSYYVVLPFAFEFFRAQYASIGITPTIRITEHLALIMKALLGFGLVFEMPVLAFFLGRLGVIRSSMLTGGARYAVVSIFLLSAMLTPPDVLTQFLMAGPLIILYGISILIVRWVEPALVEEEDSSDS